MVMEMEFAQSEHSFAKEDVHWGPGNNASTITGEEKREEVPHIG